MLNMRDNCGGSCVVVIIKDFGKIWIEYFFFCKVLQELVCMVSLISVKVVDNILNKDIFLFFNLNMVKGCYYIMIKVSLDGGIIWLFEY